MYKVVTARLNIITHTQYTVVFDFTCGEIVL